MSTGTREVDYASEVDTAGRVAELLETLPLGGALWGKSTTAQAHRERVFAFVREVVEAMRAEVAERKAAERVAEAAVEAVEVLARIAADIEGEHYRGFLAGDALARKLAALVNTGDALRDGLTMGTLDTAAMVRADAGTLGESQWSNGVEVPRGHKLSCIGCRTGHEWRSPHRVAEVAR